MKVTITFDDSTHKLVPIQATDEQLHAMHETSYEVRKLAWHAGMRKIYATGIASAPKIESKE